MTAPVHPGWNGTPRIDGDTIAGLASRYLDELHASGSRDAVIVGSSLGGWIAAEMAVQDAARDAADRLVGRVILIDAVGVHVEGAPIRDFFSLDARGIAEYAWADPARGYIDPSTRTPHQLAIMAGNMAALGGYAGMQMFDPSLLGRLETIAVPTLVVWGEADRIVTPEYGRAIAAMIPGARFELVSDAGHLPHLEQPGATLAVIDAFL